MYPDVLSRFDLILCVPDAIMTGLPGRIEREKVFEHKKREVYKPLAGFCMNELIRVSSHPDFNIS